MAERGWSCRTWLGIGLVAGDGGGCRGAEGLKLINEDTVVHYLSASRSLFDFDLVMLCLLSLVGIKPIT